MNDKASNSVIVRLQKLDGQQVIDIPPEFDLGVDDVTLEYDGKRIIMTAAESTDRSVEEKNHD